MQVVVDGLLTTYRTKGRGRPVVLLHGWGDDHTTFRRQFDTLSQGFRVVALDLPGFGQTEPPESVWDLDNYVEFVSHFMAKLGLGAPAAIVGHSNGGALAIRGLATGQLQADKLILLAASGIRTGNSLKRTSLKIIAKVGKVATLWLPPAARRRLRQKLYGVAGSDMLVAPALQETFKRTVRQDVQADAGRLNLPTLLIFATADRAVPISHGQRYAELIKSSRLFTLEGSDHFLHQTASQQVNQQIKGFLNA